MGSATPLATPATANRVQGLIAGLDGHDHVVQFYSDDARLTRVVADFLGEGLEVGDALVVIATEAHRGAFSRELLARGLDVAVAVANGQLTFLDARATLDTFMVGEVPDWSAFVGNIGTILQQVSAGGRRVRAYGEMVDLLWREGKRSAAIHLEGFWNEIAKLQSFTLLCAYVMGNFYKHADRQEFEQICGAHAQVLPEESYDDAADPVERWRQVASLQQRALALETELQERKLLEQALRAALEDRRRAEQEVLRSKQEIQDFIDNAAEGLHWVNGEGRIVWANNAELELLGYSTDEYVGHHISEFHADPEIIGDILARLERNETLKGYEARLKAKDGSIKHVLISSNVFRRDGEFIHTRCFTRDITDRKRAEDEARLRYEFEQQIIGIVSHDLRNPINAITMSASLARTRTNDERVTKALSRITAGAERASRIISDLLDLTQARLGGGIPVQPERTDLHDLVRAVVDEHAAAHPGRQWKLEESGDVEGDWDAERLLQALSNLVSNALQYSPPGTPIRIESGGRGEEVFVSVHNQGTPIPAGDLPRIFEPFKRANGARSTKSLGLGLFIVERIVAAHGGRIECRSTAAEGTTFEMILPRRPPREGTRDIAL